MKLRTILSLLLLFGIFCTFDLLSEGFSESNKTFITERPLLQDKKIHSDKLSFWEKKNDGKQINMIDDEDKKLYAPPGESGDGQKLTDEDAPAVLPLSMDLMPVLFLILSALIYATGKMVRVVPGIESRKKCRI